MVRRRLPAYVQAFMDRHDKPRHYFRRGPTRIVLPGLPWSADFMMAHAEALEASALASAKSKGKAAPKRAKAPTRGKAKPGSFAALIADYRASSGFTGLAASTALTYGRLLDRLESAHGDLPVAKMTRANVERLIDIRASEGGPEAGNGLRRTLKLLMKLAVRRDYRPDDPTLGVEKVSRPKGEKRGNRAWTEDDIARFITHHPLGTREHLALALLLCTGQRRGDIVKIGPANIVGGYDPKDFKGKRIALTQRKTGKALILPIAPMLAEALEVAAIPADAPAFLITKHKGPFTPESFSGQFTEWAKLSGIADQASPHGLRHAAARRLAEAGCSVHMIAAVTGHVTLSEVENYTKTAGQQSLAELAMSRLLNPTGSSRPS
jgi:integrase